MALWTLRPLSFTTAPDPNCGIWYSQVQGLLTSGYTNYVCPFGIMIVGDGTNDPIMQESASFIAQLFDQDNDGVLDVKMTAIRNKIGAATESGGMFIAQREAIFNDLGCFLTGSMMSGATYFNGCIPLMAHLGQADTAK